MSNKNHEGYTDITASKAIRNVDKEKCKHEPGAHLKYRIGRLQVFKDIVKKVR